MRKSTVLALTGMLVLSLCAAAPARTIDEEKQAVRQYLSVVDAKIIKFRKAGDKAKMTAMQEEKQGTLRRWAKLHAELTAAAAAVPASPESFVAAVPDTTYAVKIPRLGLTMAAKAGFTAGLTSLTADLDYDISYLVPRVKVRMSADYITGNNPDSAAAADRPMKAVSLKLGGLYSIGKMNIGALPVDWYVGGSYSLPVKVNGARTGKYGLEAYIGGNSSISPAAGGIYGELGYGTVKYEENTSALRGVNASVGYNYSF